MRIKAMAIKTHRSIACDHASGIVRPVVGEFLIPGGIRDQRAPSSSASDTHHDSHQSRIGAADQGINVFVALVDAVEPLGQAMDRA
jgi:hypothetical protein